MCAHVYTSQTLGVPVGVERGDLLEDRGEWLMVRISVDGGVLVVEGVDVVVGGVWVVVGVRATGVGRGIGAKAERGVVPLHTHTHKSHKFFSHTSCLNLRVTHGVREFQQVNFS